MRGAERLRAFDGVEKASIEWAIQASGLSELIDAVALPDGSVALLGSTSDVLTIAGQTITANGSTLFAVIVDHAGRGLWSTELMTGAVYAAPSIPRSDGSLWVAVHARGDMVLDPKGQALALALPADGLSVLLLHVSRTQIELVATVSAKVGRFEGFASEYFDDGVVIGGSVSSKRISIAVGDSMQTAEVDTRGSIPG